MAGVLVSEASFAGLMLNQVCGLKFLLFQSLKKSKLRRGSGQQLKTKVESQHGDDEKLV